MIETSDPILADLRHLIAVTAGAVVAKGFISAEWLPVILGAAGIVLNLWWSRWTKNKQLAATARAVDIALASPSDRPPSEVLEAAKEKK